MKPEPPAAHAKPSSSSRSARREGGASKEAAKPKGGFFTTWSPWKTAALTVAFLSWFQGFLDTHVGDDDALRRLANIAVVLTAVGVHAWRDPVGRRVFGSLLFAMGSLCIMAFSSSIAWWRNPKHLDHLPDVVHEHVPFIDAVLVPYSEALSSSGEPLVFTGLEIAELLMTFVIVSTLVWVFSQPWRWLVFRRILVVYGSLGLWRSVTILLTTLPDASPRCHTKTPGATALADMPAGEVFTRGLSIFAFTILDPCRTAGDMVFSGHSMVLVLCGMAWHTYYGVRPGTFVVNPVKFLMWTTIIVALFMVVVSRFHYTLDVILAVYFTVTMWGAYHRAADDILVGHRFVSVWVADGLIIYPAIEWMEAPALGEAKQAGMVTKNLRIVARFKAKQAAGGSAAATGAGAAAGGGAAAATGSAAAGATGSSVAATTAPAPAPDATAAVPSSSGGAAAGPHHTHPAYYPPYGPHGGPYPGYPGSYPHHPGYPYGYDSSAGNGSPRGAAAAGAGVAHYPYAWPGCPCCPPPAALGSSGRANSLPGVSSPASPMGAGGVPTAGGPEGYPPSRRVTAVQEGENGEEADGNSRRRAVPAASSPLTEASDASSEAPSTSASSGGGADRKGSGEDELSPALLAAVAEQLKHEDGTDAVEPPSAGAVAYVEAVLQAERRSSLAAEEGGLLPPAASEADEPPQSSSRHRSRRNTAAGEGLPAAGVSGSASGATSGAGAPAHVATVLGSLRGSAPAPLGSPEAAVVGRPVPIAPGMLTPPPAGGMAAAAPPGGFHPHPHHPLHAMPPHLFPPAAMAQHHSPHHPHFNYPGAAAHHPSMLPPHVPPPYMYGPYPGAYGLPPGFGPGGAGGVGLVPFGAVAGGGPAGPVAGPGGASGPAGGRRGSLLRFDRSGGGSGRGGRPLPPGYVRVVSIQPRATFGADGGLSSGVAWDEDGDEADGEWYEDGEWEGGEAWEGPGEWDDIDAALGANGGGGGVGGSYRGRGYTGGPSSSPFMGGMAGPGGYRSRAGSGVSTAGPAAAGLAASPALGPTGMGGGGGAYRRRRASTAGNGVLRSAAAGPADASAAGGSDGDDGSASLRQVASLLARTFQSVYRAGRRNGGGTRGASSSGEEERPRPQSVRLPAAAATTHLGASPVSGAAGPATPAAPRSEAAATAATLAAATGIDDPARWAGKQ